MDITTRQIIKQVTILATERPDFVYTDQEGRSPGAGCGYAGREGFSTEGEGCIIGQALSRLGLPEDELRELDDEGGVYSVLDRLGVPATHGREASFLAMVQENQDQGRPWGMALAQAKSVYPEIF